VTTSPVIGIPSMGYLVWHLSLRWQVELSRALAPLGITHSDYALLASLNGLEQAGIQPSQRELGESSGLEPMHVSKLVRALEERGLLRRRPHPNDPRAMQIALTDAGTQSVRSARMVVTRIDNERLRSLGGPSSERAAQLRTTLLGLLREARQDARPPDEPRAGTSAP
jgi:DNA-binding MarR family transcriptional regulator